MTIFFVTNNYTPYSGGVVSSIDTAASELREQGHTVYIITLSFLQDEQDEPFVLRVPCPIKFKYKKNHMAVPFFVKKFLQKQFITLRPDVVHVHHPFLLGITALNIARKQKIPVVFTYHTLYEHYTHYVPFLGHLVKPFIKKRSFNFCNAVDVVVAPSDTIACYVREHGVYKSIQVIPSAIAPIFLQDKSVINARIERIHMSKRGTFQLLTVSRFAQEKSIPFLLDAFALLDQQKCALTLVGYGAYGDFLRNYAYHILCLSPERVQFIEKPGKQQLAALYVAADLFLFASQTETQGLVVNEAMGAGLPVIARFGPGVQDVIKEGINGFLVHSSIEMVEKINGVLQDNALYRKLSYKAWETSQQYTKKIMAEKLVALYSQA